jgi:hypothetical protein
MDRLAEAKKQIGKEFVVNPNELHNFKNGKCQLTFKEKQDVTWYIDVELLSSEKMKITDIRRDSIIKTCAK